MNDMLTLTLTESVVPFVGQVKHLKGVTTLRMLTIGGTQVTDAGVKQLRAALPKCRIVR